MPTTTMEDERAPASAAVPDVEVRGASIPALGFGTWELEGAEAERMVETALELGYRHVDTAEMYGNETAVGRALRASDVAREEVFLTTKIWPDHYASDAFMPAVRASLDRLSTDYVDLLLPHWPSFESASLRETMENLNAARAEGLTRHIGVSNFTVALLEQALDASEGPLVVDQVEYHPYLDQTAVLGAVRRHGMALTAYSPLAKGRAPRDETLRAIGERHGASAAQVALRWHLQQDGVVAIPRTSSAKHCLENLRALELELDEGEMEAISDLAVPGGRLISPAGLAPDWD